MKNFKELNARSTKKVTHRTNAGLCVQRTNCLWLFKDMETVGVSALGYTSWADLWRDYVVFGIARSPFDRAASTYNYLLQRRAKEVRHLQLFWLQIFMKYAFDTSIQQLLVYVTKVNRFRGDRIDLLVKTKHWACPLDRAAWANSYMLFRRCTFRSVILSSKLDEIFLGYFQSITLFQLIVFYILICNGWKDRMHLCVVLICNWRMKVITW